MSMKRGNFILSCDHPDCDAEIDLETDSFEEAIQTATEYKQENDWSTIRKGSSYADICGDH